MWPGMLYILFRAKYATENAAEATRLAVDKQASVDVSAQRRVFERSEHMKKKAGQQLLPPDQHAQTHTNLHFEAVHRHAQADPVERRDDVDHARNFLAHTASAEALVAATHNAFAFSVSNYGP
jgi:hypothetical protein